MTFGYDTSNKKIVIQSPGEGYVTMSFDPFDLLVELVLKIENELHENKQLKGDENEH